MNFFGTVPVTPSVEISNQNIQIIQQEIWWVAEISNNINLILVHSHIFYAMTEC